MLNYSFDKIKANFLFFLLIRIFVGLFFFKTVHKTDEYFQGPEVAHNIVYGYGQLTWQWTFKDPIRSPVYPMIYSIGYYILNIFGLSNNSFLFKITPKLVQAFIGASFDTLLIKINEYYNGKESNRLLVFLNLTNWATLTYFSRTYVNSVETVLTTLAFYFWLLSKAQSGIYKQYQIIGQQSKKRFRYDFFSRLIVIICFIMRGTSIVFWVVVWPYELFKYHFHSFKQAKQFIFKNITTVLIMCILSTIISSLWYKRIVFVEYNFFYYNVLKGWSSLCGTQPWFQFIVIYQYKIFGANAIFLLYYIYTIFKKKESNQKFNELLLINLIMIFILSLSAHKQLRFMLILVPSLFSFLIKGYNLFPMGILKKTILILSLLGSAYWMVTRNFVIKKGGLVIMDYIRQHSEINEVLYNMQSYQLPMYSYIHRNISLIIPEASFETAIQNRSQLVFSRQNPQKYLQSVSKRIGHSPQYMITTSQAFDSSKNDKLVLKQKWKLILNQSYYSPMQQHQNRRIYLFKNQDRA